MSAEIWRSELLLYGFMILNVAGVSAALGWAWRRGLFGGPEDPAASFPMKENRDG